MIDQAELFDVLAEVRRHHPEWRFGQLITNVASWAGEERPGEVWDVSDEQLLRAAREHLANVNRTTVTPTATD